MFVASARGEEEEEEKGGEEEEEGKESLRRNAKRNSKHKIFSLVH